MRRGFLHRWVSVALSALLFLQFAPLTHLSGEDHHDDDCMHCTDEYCPLGAHGTDGEAAHVADHSMHDHSDGAQFCSCNHDSVTPGVLAIDKVVFQPSIASLSPADTEQEFGSAPSLPQLLVVDELLRPPRLSA